MSQIYNRARFEARTKRAPSDIADTSNRIAEQFTDQPMYDMFEFLLRGKQSFFEMLMSEAYTEVVRDTAGIDTGLRRIAGLEFRVEEVTDEVALFKLLRDYTVGDLAERHADYDASTGTYTGMAEWMRERRNEGKYIVSQEEQNKIMGGINADKKAELDALYLVLKNAAIELLKTQHPEAAAEEEAGRDNQITDKFGKIKTIFGKDGILFLYYDHVIKPMGNMEKFWGMESKGYRKWFFRLFTFVIPVVTVAAIAFELTTGIYFLPLPLAVHTLLATASATLYPIIMGYARNAKQKLFWGSIFGIFSVYYGGAMVALLFSSTAIVSLNAGFFITLFLMALTALPTLASIYHFVLAVKSYYELQDEVYSKTVRSLVGFKSLNPFTINPTVSAGFAIFTSLTVFAFTLSPLATLISGIIPVLLTTGLQPLKDTVATFKANIKEELSRIDPRVLLNKVTSGNVTAGMLLTYVATSSIPVALAAGLGLALAAAIRSGEYKTYRTPVLGLIQETLKTLKPFGTPASLKVGAPVIGLTIAYLLTGSLPAVAAIAAIAVVVSALSPRTRAEFWEDFYGKLVAEIEGIEAANTLVVGKR